MQPTCTRFVGDEWRHIADNASGVTLEEALMVMIRTLRSELLCQRRTLRGRRDRPNRPFRNWEGERIEMQNEHEAYFGSAERWEEHVVDFPNIVAMFDEAVAEVGRIFEGITDWDDED